MDRVLAELARVLFLSKSTPVFGGVERWLADLSAGLERLGHQCTTALALGKTFHDPAKYREAYPELRTTELDGLTGSKIGRHKAVSGCLSRLSPDVVIPVMLADGLRVSAEQKARQGYKLVYPVHELAEGVEADIARYGTAMDRIVFVDRSSKARYRQVCEGMDEKLSLIRCGVPPACRQRMNRESSLIRLGYCGRLEHFQKRVLDLAELCSRLDALGLEFTVDIVGEGSCANALAHEMAGIRSRHSVRFWGARSRDELYREFYPRINTLFIPSIGETGPLAAFEAIVNGVWVICSDFRGRAENGILRNGENCSVFPVGNMEAAATAFRDRVDALRQFQGSDGAMPVDSAMVSLQEMVNSWDGLIRQISMEEGGQAAAQSHQAISPGRTKFSATERMLEFCRRVSGKHYVHSSVRSEWPFYN